MGGLSSRNFGNAQVGREGGRERRDEDRGRVWEVWVGAERREAKGGGWGWCGNLLMTREEKEGKMGDCGMLCPLILFS
jgi:hypothetical protein